MQLCKTQLYIMVSIAWNIQSYIINMMASVFLFALLQNYGNSVDCVTYSNTNAKEKRKCILWIVVALFYTRNISYNNACIEIQKKSFIRGNFLYYIKLFWRHSISLWIVSFIIYYKKDLPKKNFYICDSIDY